MTKNEAHHIFLESILPNLAHTDKVAKRTAWNDWVDSLEKDGTIDSWQAQAWVNPFN